MSGFPYRSAGEAGHTLVEVMAGVVIMGLAILTLYQVFIPTLALSHSTTVRLERQQDVRLAIDRMTRDLHETAATRVVVYGAGNGCAEAYEGCIGFVTPRQDCSGAFQLAGGFPSWQATIYMWRDVASNELRLRCDTTTTVPVSVWPPVLTPHSVIGTRVIQAAFTLQPAGSPSPTSIAVMLREQSEMASRPSRRYQTEFVNQTILLPQNR
ncbi:MAG: PilW family protein [Armatimonadota bacterium]